MKKLLLAAVALAALTAGPAVAADLGRKAPAYIPPPAPPPPTFTGCYVDGGVGYGLWNIDHFGQFAGLQTSETTSGGRGWLGRVGGGCDYQFGGGGGFFGPTMVGWAKDYTGSFAGGLYALAGFALMSAVISALWLRIPNPVRQDLASVPAE